MGQAKLRGTFEQRMVRTVKQLAALIKACGK